MKNSKNKLHIKNVTFKIKLIRNDKSVNYLFIHLLIYLLTYLPNYKSSRAFRAPILGSSHFGLKYSTEYSSTQRSPT